MTMKIGLILFASVWFSAILISCHKENPPKAIITIVDTGGVRVPNVKVTVYANPNGSYVDPQGGVLNEVLYTDGSGDASFSFKNKAILNVKALLRINIGTTQVPIWKDLEGKKLLILEEDKTVPLTIQIK